MAKSLNFIVQTMVFDGLEGCMCERERYQKNIKNDTKIHPNTYEKSIQKHARKGMQKSWKNTNKWATKRGEINNKHIKKEVQKSMRKKQKKKHRYFDRAPGTLIGYLQGTPPVQNPHIKDTTHKVLCKIV